MKNSQKWGVTRYISIVTSSVLTDATVLTNLPQQIESGVAHSIPPQDILAEQSVRWFAVYTMPRSEQSVRRMLDIRQIESFCPTFEVQRVWKNRQRVKIQRPLFPSYVFIHIHPRQRSLVLNASNALRIVGNRQGPTPIPDREIEFLRSDFCRNRVEPYLDLVVGTRVRIRSGPMAGLEGTLVQKRNNLRFILTVAMINQHAAVEVQADVLEAVSN